MKNFLILFLIICSSSAYSQKGLSIEILAQPGISMGGDFKFPTNFLYNEFHSLPKKLTFGMNAGVDLNYNFSDKIGISLGLLYSKQGQDYKDFTWEGYQFWNEIDTFKRSVTLHYLNIPLQFTFNTSPAKKVSFLFSAGFYFGFLVGYKDYSYADYHNTGGFLYSQGGTANGGNLYRTIGIDTGTINDTTTMKTWAYNIFDLGGIVSAGLQFKLSEKIFLPVTFNYQIGFIDIKNHDSKYEGFQSGDNEYLYWDSLFENTPNDSVPYRNSLAGMSIGLKFMIN